MRIKLGKMGEEGLVSKLKLYLNQNMEKQELEQGKKANRESRI